MTRPAISDLIVRAERIVEIIDKWGGKVTLGNRLDLVDEFLSKAKAKTDVIIQLDRASGTTLLFKALLSVDETALYLGVHRNTVNLLIDTHGLLEDGTSSSKVLLLTEDIEQWCRTYQNGVSVASIKPSTQKKKGTRK